MPTPSNSDKRRAVHRPPLAPDLTIAALERYPERTALHIGGRELTYREVRDQISRYSQAFASLGLSAGSPVAMLSPNRPEVLFAQGANTMTGCRTSALHPMGSLEDHAYVLEDAGIRTLIFDPAKYEPRAAALRERIGQLDLLALGPTEIGTDLAASAEKFDPRPLSAPDVDADDVASIAYTGGTTGKPKGVMGTYRSNLTMTTIQMTEWQWPREVRFLTCAPMSHAGGAFWTPTLLRGGSMVVLPGFDPEQVIDAIERYRITATMLVPTMIYALLDHPKLAKADLSSLETIFYGASAISPTRLREGIERLGPIFFQFYGQAESPMTICVLRKEDHDLNRPERLASCGRPVPWLHVRLLDDAHQEVELGEPGEICVRGPLLMKGYLDKPEQTDEVFAGGWLHTGDVARADDDGFLTIVDRKKDMIVSGGFNVYPREVEDVLSSHPAVAAAAVIGVPDERWGEAVKAVIVLRHGAHVEAEELIEMVRQRKGSVHAPKSVDFVDQIPVTAVGKPDKKSLRAPYWEGSERMVN